MFERRDSRAHGQSPRGVHKKRVRDDPRASVGAIGRAELLFARTQKTVKVGFGMGRSGLWCWTH